MQKSLCHFKSNSSFRVLPQQCLRRLSKRHCQIASGQPSSPTVFPEKQRKRTSLREHKVNGIHESPGKEKAQEHIIDIGDEHCDLIGDEVFSGKLALDNKSKNAGAETGSGTSSPNIIDAKLTSKAMVWGSHKLSLEDVISVSYNAGLRHFTVHSYPLRKRSCGLSCFSKPCRNQMDYRFLASNSEEAIQWVSSFANQQCFVNCLPHPMLSSQKQSSNIVARNPLYDLPHFKSRTPPKVLVILNPRSGHGRSSRVFHGEVEPIFKVLNGLLSRDDQQVAISIPIGIIPAGSDNSLVWTVLGVRDPVSAAMAIVKGGFTAIDVLAVEWIRTRAVHFGMTVSYFGFLGDVLELSEKYQKHFGPLRYFVAGFLKFLFLPKYSFELEYLPSPKEEPDKGKALNEKAKLDMQDLYRDIVRRSNREGIPRASSLSSIDSIMTPSRMSPGELDTTGSMLASTEPFEDGRGLDPNSKHLSSGRSNLTTKPEEVLHPQSQLSPKLNWPRMSSKSRTDKGWTGLNETNVSRCSWADTAINDRDDISSTLSDPGPNWDSEPKWDTEPNWDPEPNWEVENPVHLPEPPTDMEVGVTKELIPRLEEKWVVKKGHFLGVLVCNHSCKTVQSLSSQVVAPTAEHDDNSLDLLLVHGRGRLRLLRFFICLQFGCHLSLPYVEYIKVKSVRIRPTKNTHNGCGIDGELLRVNGQVMCSLLPNQCRLIGHPARDCE
ncbi:sphingoid long-chain bases kinase 1 isoform X2 [Elaeis guineensis]|uniref:Sphingoid long-chain bases kinase 1 isoform X2 n=1 Tax=Elaeis guineensis var. tenera TaxID=51953 RepID=A0A6I9SBR9_ELAGV|nr:sphingoid long-chain bases kinase 1 isoform X2 [Elaeis guineensis]